MNRLELAARVLVAAHDARPQSDLTELLDGLRAALGDDPTPFVAFSGEEESYLIKGAREGTEGLRVVFAREAVGLWPVGLPGFCLSYPAAYAMRDLLAEKLRSCTICGGEIPDSEEGPEC